MSLTEAQLIEALRTVEDPDLHKDLVTLNMVRNVRSEDRKVEVTIELTTPACPMKDKIRADVEAAVRRRAADASVTLDQVQVTFTAPTGPARPAGDGADPLPAVRQIIAVGAGKGGVGKSSTVATNLAVRARPTRRRRSACWTATSTARP